MSGRKQESERSRMEIADTEAAVPRAARPKPNSTAPLPHIPTHGSKPLEEDAQASLHTRLAAGSYKR